MSGCTIGDCGRPARVRQMCTLHYQRWLRNGDPLVKLRKPMPRPNKHYRFSPELWWKWLRRRSEAGDTRLREGIAQMRRMLEERSK